jgi:hypothetical protein
MDRNAVKLARLFKRLKAAVGYHELGMTRHAVQCLDSLTDVGELGPFALVADVLRGEFLRGSADQFSTASALEVAEGLAPREARRAIRMTLVTCFGNSPEPESGLTSRSSPAAAVGR